MKCLLFIKICMHKSISNKVSKRPTNQYGRFETTKVLIWPFRNDQGVKTARNNTFKI